MKNFLLLLIFAGLCYGCHPPGANRPAESGATPDQSSEVLKAPEAEAAQKAYSGNVGEVDLALMALQKTKSSEVKNLAMMIQEDHQKAQRKLEEMAGALDMEFREDATAEQERLKKELAELEGPAFDRQFVEAQVHEHEKDLEFYKQHAQSAGNSQLANYYSENVPVLEKHLEKAKEVKTGLDGG